MPRNSPPNRRSFLKKVVATSSATSGLLASAGTVAADHDDTEVVISSAGGTGSYVVYVNDPNAHGKDGTLEGDDGVRSGSSSSELSGDIGSTSDEDIYVYDGEITDIYFDGNLELEVRNPNINVSGTVTASGSYSNGGADYSFCVGSSIDDSRNLEGCDNVGDGCVSGCINSSSDEDYYDISGVITYAKNESDGDSILLEYNIN